MSTYYPPGRYIGRVVSQKFGRASTGNPQFILSFEVMGQVDTQNPEGVLPIGENYVRSIFRTITDKTIDYFVDDLERLGFQAQTDSPFFELDPNNPTHHSFVGQEIEVLCKHESYEGQEKERWSLFGGSNTPQVEPLASAEMRRLDALYGKSMPKASKKQQRNEKRQPATVPEQTETEGEDDIPF